MRSDMQAAPFVSYGGAVGPHSVQQVGRDSYGLPVHSLIGSILLQEGEANLAKPLPQSLENAENVQVTSVDGKTYTAKVIGTDSLVDRALIKIDGKDFPYVKPRIGDWVPAVGNPFGLGETVTAGNVSALGRDFGAGPYDDFIQIDAPVNKGNSGGPSFDMDGNVIGVNTAIFSPSGGSVGIAFDIPADTAKRVITQLREKGSATRGWFGVQIQRVTPEIAESLGLKKAAGALVSEPQPNSPAAKAGIESGDVITAVDDNTVSDARGLREHYAGAQPLSDRLTELLKQIKRSTGGREGQDVFGQRHRPRRPT
jgi:serine protease Do